MKKIQSSVEEQTKFDLILQKSKLEAEEYRSTILKAVADGGKMLGEGLQSYLDDTTKLRIRSIIKLGKRIKHFYMLIKLRRDISIIIKRYILLIVFCIKPTFEYGRIFY